MDHGSWTNDFPLLPDIALWKHQSTTLTTDTCNLEAILQEQGGDIFTFFPQNFDVYDASPEAFLFKIINSSPNGQSSLCAIIDGDFTCEQLYNAVSFETPNVTLEFQIIKEGTILSSNQMNFSIELQLTNCDGDPLACGSLALAGIYIPCSSFVTTQASP